MEMDEVASHVRFYYVFFFAGVGGGVNTRLSPLLKRKEIKRRCYRRGKDELCAWYTSSRGISFDESVTRVFILPVMRAQKDFWSFYIRAC